MEVKPEIKAVEIDLTPSCDNSGFSVRITKNWYILIRNKANGLVMEGHLGDVLAVMKESINRSFTVVQSEQTR